MIDKILILAAAKDINIIEDTLNSVLKNLKSKSYYLICDESIYIKLITSKFNSKVFIIRERIFLKHSQIKSINNLKNKTLIPWYMQQLIKLEFCSRSRNRDIILIWDGDTIPSKPINFFVNKKMVYYVSNEYHLEYFISIKKLIGLNKKIQHSFVAQCFILRAEWAKMMIKVIQARTNKYYFDSIISNANSSPKQNFSEFETLGTFINKYFFYEYQVSFSKWLRYGFSIYGSPKNMFKKSIDFEFVSFESWDNSFFKCIFLNFIYFFKQRFN
jgi:hypothetical protein